ncbi:MAG: hypothetical protein ACLR23_15055 [Clostridia bacterium]
MVTRKAIEKKQAEQAKKDAYATLEKGIDALLGVVVGAGQFLERLSRSHPRVDGLVHVDGLSYVLEAGFKHPSDIVHEGDVVQCSRAGRRP